MLQSATKWFRAQGLKTYLDEISSTYTQPIKILSILIQIPTRQISFLIGFQQILELIDRL
jgi:hypothetical protein